ncbi:MAG: DUF1330 domain-containing protein [SAR324 cluster bacterium]|nr:DUF1330 domain-containing protein [SAR324 cluster bacterium]
MSAYVLIHGTPKNAEKMQEYSAAAGSIVGKFGGELLVRGAADVLCGEHSHKIVVLMKFPDAETAHKWYDSAEYQALIPIREEGIESTFILCGE